MIAVHSIVVFLVIPALAGFVCSWIVGAIVALYKERRGK